MLMSECALPPPPTTQISMKEADDLRRNIGTLPDSLQPLLQNKSLFFIENSDDARKVLSTRLSRVRGGRTTDIMEKMVEKANIHGIILPWHPFYRMWWYLTAMGAILTVFLIPYQVAFVEAPPGTVADAGGLGERALTLLFVLDILVNFNLASPPRQSNELIIWERRQIAIEYWRGMFWLDFVGVFPLETLALLYTGNLGESSKSALMLSLLRLLYFVRLHRMKKLSDELQYNATVSLLSFTLLRNFYVVMLCAHCQACCMYFLARLHGFDDDTWLGPIVHDMTGFDRYITSFYWSITTFCTVGYGDFSPVNLEEKIAGSFFMLLNIVIAAWIIGSITLLIVKQDGKTGEYRDSLEALHQYGEMHDFDQPFLDKLKEQLRLEFNNREIADEQVLKHFPSAVRRKILRRHYKEHLETTHLMKGVRPQFVDAFLTSCTVEIFSPGEEIVERGSILSDLFLLVGGMAEVTATPDLGDPSCSKEFELLERCESNNSTQTHSFHSQQLEAGDFIGEIGFFTESPQVDSVLSLTVCKTLTMSRSTYKLLAQDHPGSVGKILQNLLAKVKDKSLQLQLPRPIEVLRVGSAFDMEAGYGSAAGTVLSPETESVFRRKKKAHESLSAVEALVTMREFYVFKIGPS